MRFTIALLVAGCSASHAPKSPVSHRAAPAADGTLAPVLETPAGSDDCPLRWDELARATPPIVEMVQSATPRKAMAADTNCPGFDPTRMTCPDGVDCETGRVRGGHQAVVTRVSTSSASFVTIGFAVEDKGFACIAMSMPLMRSIYPFAPRMLDEPLLSDLDGDGESELLVWSRLPWGDAEEDSAFVPVVYAFDGSRLVRRDDFATKLRSKVATVYRDVVDRGKAAKNAACFTSVATAFSPPPME